MQQAERLVSIQNNTALKHTRPFYGPQQRLVSIQNNTALKQRHKRLVVPRLFGKHSKQHSSKTERLNQ